MDIRKKHKNIHKQSIKSTLKFSKSNSLKISVILLILYIQAYTFAQNTTQQLPKGVETPASAQEDPENDQTASSSFLKQKPQISIKNISPSHGPQTGDTRVTVRGGPFTIYKDTYPNPKCRFGNDSMIVSAAYITCLPTKPRVQDREGKKDTRNNTCIQCEESPPSFESKPVAFTVSLTGDFSDVSSSVEFYYYKPCKVNAIKPIFGAKDGETIVQVWGENFQDFGEDVTCSFGTKSVSAKVHDSGYITCVSPQSDVVQRAMPFSISLNSQQQSKERIDFWYYNDPQVTLLLPDTGPERGGNTIDLRGNNFKPFRTDQGEPDMSNSTFCYFTSLGTYRKATVLNSTRLTCKVPESYYYRETAVEVTLNAADRTDDNTMYHYYKPPFLFDAQPSQGPVNGKTKVKVVGTNFTDTGNITCRFGKKTVLGKYLSSSEILCIAPQVQEPGFVDLTVSFYAGLDSAAIQYLYYQTPVVSNILPTSGPDYGYTQIAVTGKNFVDLGNDLALCVFNRTHFTNATVMSDTLILCDSPSLLDNQGYSSLPEGGLTYSVVDISIDGGLEFSKSDTWFYYYRDPVLNSITPQLGPITGGTTVTIHGFGFSQQGISRRIIRLGIVEVEPISFTNETITFQAPNVNIPITTTVSVSLNGQQFTKQKQVNSPGKQLTYDYYYTPYVSFYNPHQGPTNGGTSMRVEGYGFRIRRPHLQDRLWARFYDQSQNKQFSNPIEIEQINLGSDTFQWLTPAVSQAQDVLLQISLNNQDWHDARNPQEDGGFTYYISPHITKLTPSFGHVKATQAAIVQITGSGFACLDEGCLGLLCRFGNNPESYIYSRANFTSSENIQCFAPQYTKPDVLNVEITINGESFTNDNKTYGYFDPFVIDANPKLLSTDGTTQVSIKGLGFVDSGQSMALFSNSSSPILCQQNQCTKTATFQDQHTLITSTFVQSDVKYQGNGQSVLWDPMYIDATVIGDGFTDNQVEVFYYQDPKILQTNINESPANIQSQVLISIDFQGNNMARIVKYATPTCRFSVGSKVQYTEGLLIAYPLTEVRDPNLVNTIHCRSPQWDLDSYYYSEKATLDISLNEQNYLGKLPFAFLRTLVLHRDVPMSGPQEIATQIKLYGQGFRFDKGSAEVKWGILSTQNIPSSDVQDYYYYLDKFLDQNLGSQELRAYQTEAQTFKRVDSQLIEGGDYDLVTMQSQLQDITGTQEGPAYLDVGIDEFMNKTFYNQTSDGDTFKTLQQIQTFNYNPQNVEYYMYKNPTVLRMHPRSGLTKGDTLVQVIGIWFKYMPEYGIVPHCKFGDKIVRAYFDSTVRLVCKTPPNSNTVSKLPFEVSLNGVDWSTTGFTFSYYDEPIMTDIYPDMGSIAGSEEIFIKGDKFTNITDPEEFMCRFSPTSLQIPPKTVKAKFINSTTIMCTSPGGWTEADKVILQITWNGVDYDQNDFKYSFYSIHRAFPRSGPSDGKGGDIIIYGQGFREDTSPKCMLNDTYYDPTLVTDKEIRCPMPAALEGDSYFGNVDLAVSANGISWFNFDGGFQYYEQPIVEDIDPKTGPSSGIGIINFYGQNFRADYPLAELGCKIGNGTGRAFFVSTRQVKCVVENMPLLSEDDDPLPAQVSLNSYSYTEVGDDTYYRPYGVLLLQPNSGPVGGFSTIIVQGQGFVPEEGVTPRCRFGTPANFAIVEAQILSYTRLACRTPEALALTPTSALPRDIPFSIALSGDEFNPWTKTSHKFRFYTQPVISRVDPEEVDVGRIFEVYIQAAEDSEFFEPMPQMPVDSTNLIEDSDEQIYQQPQGGLSAIKCKFGRFGESTAVLINQTTVKCTTPPTDESPDSIYRETVIISVAMNGQDFLEQTSSIEFTFIGTAPYISFATIVLTLLAIGFVGFAGTLCTSDRFQLGQLRDKSIPNRPRGANAYGGQLRQNISQQALSES